MLAICPSVRLSHSWFTLKRLNILKCLLHRTIERSYICAFSAASWASCLTLTMSSAQYCLRLTFKPKLTHPAVRSLCDSSASCYLCLYALHMVMKLTYLSAGSLLQTMGGDFSSRGKQDCSKGIYILAGLLLFSHSSYSSYLFLLILSWQICFNCWLLIKATPTLVGEAFIFYLWTFFLPRTVIAARRRSGAPSKVYQWLGPRCRQKVTRKNFTNPPANFYRGQKVLNLAWILKISHLWRAVVSKRSNISEI